FSPKESLPADILCSQRPLPFGETDNETIGTASSLDPRSIRVDAVLQLGCSRDFSPGCNVGRGQGPARRETSAPRQQAPCSGQRTQNCAYSARDLSPSSSRE